MSKLEKLLFTAAEYLAMERRSSEKHEVVFGEIIPTPRVSARHVVIVGNIAGELGNQLHQRPDRVFSSTLWLCMTPDCYYT